MTAANPRSTRRGTATLELVLVFPMLLFCAAGVFYAGRAGLARTKAAAVARFDAWNEMDKAFDPKGLYLFGAADSQKREAMASQKFKPWVKGPKNPVATSGTKVFTSTWDHHSVRFETKRGLFIPHLKVLGKIGKLGDVGETIEDVGGKLSGALEWILTNKYLLGVAEFANKILDVGAWWLDNTLLPVVGVGRDFVYYVLHWPPISDFSEELNFMDVFTQSVQNLVDATDEKPGKWFGPGQFKLLKDYFD